MTQGNVSRAFGRSEAGTSSIEFAMIFPPLFLLILVLFDVAYAHYVRNSFERAVNETARTVYVEPGTTQTEIEDALTAALTSFGGDVEKAITTTTHGSTDYWVLSAQTTYRYKVPPLSMITTTITASSRVPVLTYQASS